MEFTLQLKQVLRRLRRAPMFTFLTLLMLAAGIGANTAVFSVVDGVLLKPLPYSHPEQLVAVKLTAPGVGLVDAQLAPSDYFIFREQGRVFQDIGLYQTDAVSITGVAQPERVDAMDVTDGMLPILGVKPVLGRLFSRQDDLPGAPLTTVLSYSYWQSKFGRDRSIIGKTVVADGKPRQIIGVLPANFRFLDEQNLALFIPFQFDRSKTFLGNFSFDGVARLRPDVTLAQANADVANMLPIVLRSFPTPPGFSLDLFKKARIGPNLRPLKDDVVGTVGTLLWVLMGGIGMVLLIACANVANLLLVRTEGRQQELAIRAALGASRKRIAGELLFESAILGFLGSIFGLGLAWAALRLLIVLAPIRAAAHQRYWHQSARPSFHFGHCAAYQLALRPHSSVEICWRPRRHRPARRRPHSQPEPGTPSRPQRSCHRTGRPRARPAHLLRLDDPHFSRVNSRQSGFLQSRQRPNFSHHDSRIRRCRRQPSSPCSAAN